jgi:ABC-type glycerol-3-phosphate transport system permease component
LTRAGTADDSAIMAAWVGQAPATGRPFGYERQALVAPPIETTTFWARISAMSVLSTLPMPFAVAARKRYLVRGISSGAAKG